MESQALPLMGQSPREGRAGEGCTERKPQDLRERPRSVLPRPDEHTLERKLPRAGEEPPKSVLGREQHLLHQPDWKPHDPWGVGQSRHRALPQSGVLRPGEPHSRPA